MLCAACSDMDELLTSVSPELVDEFADEFFAKRGRKILHDSRRWRVLDTWIGDPAEHFRYDTHSRKLTMEQQHTRQMCHCMINHQYS